MEKTTFYLTSFVFLVIYILSTLAYLTMRRYMRLKEKELEMEHAKMDDFRSHFERQIGELNQQFSISDKRWREVNHLVLAGQGNAINEKESFLVPQKSLFLSGHGIDLSSIQPRKNLIFVLTPFHKDFEAEFQVIARVGRELGLQVARGDENVHTGEIFPYILKLLVESRLVIANISGRNPNVFYELGIAHALDKSVILIAHKKAEVPFDIRSKRIIFYDDDANLERELERMLARTFAEQKT